MNVSVEYVRIGGNWSDSLDALSYTVVAEQSFQAKTAIFGHAYVAAGSEQTDIPLTLDEINQDGIDMVQGAIAEARQAPHLIVNTDLDTVPRAVVDQSEYDQIWRVEETPILTTSSNPLVIALHISALRHKERIRSRITDPKLRRDFAMAMSTMILGIVGAEFENMKESAFALQAQAPYAACKLVTSMMYEVPEEVCLDASATDMSGLRNFETAQDYSPLYESMVHGQKLENNDILFYESETESLKVRKGQK